MKKNKQPDIPLGLGMAFAQKIDAMNRFSSLSTEKQQQIIDGAHNIHTKQEMHQYVEQLAENRVNFF